MAVAAVAVSVLAAGLMQWDWRLLGAAITWVALILSLLVVWLLMTTADGSSPGKSWLSLRLSRWLLPLVQLWHRPVPACVQGGYTISPREDGLGPECLVTCILKVG
jgi:hypothetical protein